MKEFWRLAEEILYNQDNHLKELSKKNKQIAESIEEVNNNDQRGNKQNIDKNNKD